MWRDCCHSWVDSEAGSSLVVAEEVGCGNEVERGWRPWKICT